MRVQGLDQPVDQGQEKELVRSTLEQKHITTRRDDGLFKDQFDPICKRLK